MKDRKAPPELNNQTSETWNSVPWKKLEQHCFRIQKRIYRASQRGNQRAVQKLQKLLMKSEAARLLAVRRVTQENRRGRWGESRQTERTSAHGETTSPETLEAQQDQTSTSSLDTQAW